MRAHLAEGRQQTGQKLPGSQKEIYKAWKTYKSVAPFWAAFNLKFSQEDMDGIWTAGATPLRQGTPDERLRSCWSPNIPRFLLFLRLAHHFREWGCAHAPRHTRNPRPWLDPMTTWLWEAPDVIPDLTCCIHVSAEPLTNEAQTLLKSYRAQTRFLTGSEDLDAD